MVDPLTTSRDSELFAPFPEAWAEFLATAQKAMQVAKKLASVRHIKPELVTYVFGLIRTNGTGFYLPDFSILTDESYAPIIDSLIDVFVSAGMPLHVITFELNKNNDDFFHTMVVGEINRSLIIDRINATKVGKISLIYDDNTFILEILLNSTWHITLNKKSVLANTSTLLKSFSLGNRIVHYSRCLILRTQLEQEHCYQLMDLLEQWMQQRTIDLRTSLKDVLRSSKLPPERWPAELRSLADEIDLKPKPLPLPDKAPELFANRPDRRENIEEFLRRVWMPWIETGTLTRPAFAKLDQQGEMALRNWLRKNTLPPDIRLPTLKEVNDLALADTSKIREAERLAQIARRRRFLQQAKNTE